MADLTQQPKATSPAAYVPPRLESLGSPSSYSSPQIYRATKLLNLVVCPSSARTRMTMHDAFGHDAGDSQSQGDLETTIRAFLRARMATFLLPFQRAAGGPE
jgi:hypothetical protein